MKVDNHMLATLDTCDLKFREAMEDHWQPRFQGGALGHGIAVHAALAVWYEALKDGTSREKAMREGVAMIEQTWNPAHPIDDFRTVERAQKLFLAHIAEYPQETFQVLAVETPFKLPLGRWLDCANSFIERDPKTGLYFPEDCDLARWICLGVPNHQGYCNICKRPCELIEYGGVYDLLVQFGAGKMSTIYVMDHKTTSQLGSTYFLQFKPNNQVTGYCWGGSEMSDRKVAGAIINAMCLTASGKMNFKREITSRDAEDYVEWKDDVTSKCNRIAMNRRLGVWAKSPDACQGKYGMCGYHSIHVLTDESERQRRREVDYIKREWDFENRDGEAA